jgi:hypothetical protein
MLRVFWNKKFKLGFEDEGEENLILVAFFP